MKLTDELLYGNSKIAVWGAGYIGFSCAAFFARKGVKTLLVDINLDKANMINEGEPPYPEIKTWIGFDVKPLVKLGLLRATTNWKEALDEVYKIQIIGVNTDKEGLPWDGALRDVCGKIARAKARPLLVIVESTLTPKWTDTIVIPLLPKDVWIAVAPRRDWFTLPGQSCEILDRAVGGVTEEATRMAAEVLSIISQNIHTSDYKTAELVKAVENAYRHLCIQLACQLTLAYPHVDVREVLRLAATKWNLHLYYPSIGTGGYCIPVAPNYVLDGAEHREKLTLLLEAKKADLDMSSTIAEHLLSKGLKRFGILGLSYKGNLKVHVLTPSIRLAEALKKRGASVKINDPLYTDHEIKEISGCESFSIPNDLSEFDCIIVACEHDFYKATPKNTLLKHLTKCKYILDCHGVWHYGKEFFRSRGIEYHLTGDKEWI